MNREIPGQLASNEALLAIVEGLTACYRMRVEKRFGELVTDVSTKDNLASVATFVHSWFQNWRMRRKGMNRGMMLIGGVGNGKTTMMRAIGDYIGVLLGSANRYVSYSECEPKFHKAKDIASIVAHGNDQEFEDIKRSSILLIDDMGAEPVEVVSYGMPVHPLQDILEYRYDHMLPTFITSNMMLCELFGKNGRYPDDRLFDRVKEIFEIRTFTGGSYR